MLFFNCRLLLLLALFFMPAHVFAGMTLFNDDGGWELGVLGSSEGGKATYRACKNSMDRIKATDDKESIAILCITYLQASGEISAGIWMDVPSADNVKSVPCRLFFDDGNVLCKTCEVRPSKIGKLEIVLPDDIYSIKKLVNSSRLKIEFDNTFVRDGKISGLEFDFDPKTFARVAFPISVN